jgi:exopolyphosphatase/guanosine-5'-triphosphate,3'-diphosphate pyrophosphatase
MISKRYALIDLGSNTIKFCVYEVEDLSFQQIHYEAAYGYVIRYVQNELLLSEGTERIIKILSDFSQKAKNWECKELICFSTASLRYIKNIQEVINLVYSATGIKINPISGEEEALCNFESLRSISETPDFLGADMGGGSIQLFSSKQNQLQFAQSFPIGSLKLYTEFVKNTLPSKEEAKKIDCHVRSLLEQSRFYTDFTESPLHFMGGTVRLISKLMDSAWFTPDQLKQKLDDFLSHPKLAEETICQITPERLQTVMPGMIAANAIAEYFHISQIHYTQNSVREGFLYRHILHLSECESALSDSKSL